MMVMMPTVMMIIFTMMMNDDEEHDDDDSPLARRQHRQAVAGALRRRAHLSSSGTWRPVTPSARGTSALAARLHVPGPLPLLSARRPPGGGEPRARPRQRQRQEFSHHLIRLQLAWRDRPTILPSAYMPSASYHGGALGGSLEGLGFTSGPGSNGPA